MQKTINGIRYNTNSAILVGEASSHTPYVTDFSYWTAGLYKSPRAHRFFLAGNGGPMTVFARSLDGNTRTGGEGIIPLSDSEALEWAENHLDESTIATHFKDQVVDA